MQPRKIVDELLKHQKLEEVTAPKESVEFELKTIPIQPTLNNQKTALPDTQPAVTRPSPDIKRTPSKTTAKLRYLDSFTPEELSKLEKQYGKTAQELETVIDNYWKSYWFELSANYVGISTNLLYMVFQATANKAGIDGSVKLINPDAVVPDALSTGIGGFLAGGGLTFIFAISAKNEAAKAILEYATRDPIKERVSDALKFAANNKARAFIDSFKAVYHQSILYGSYTTGALSEILPIIDYLNSRTSFEKWLAIAAIQYFGCRFSTSYATPSYFEGVKFWENDNGRDLYLMSTLPSNLNDYKKSYILINNQLYYIRINGTPELVTINSQSVFTSALSSINTRNQTKIHLTNEQINQLITSNGGHTPEKGRPWLVNELMKGNIATPLQVFFQGIISSSLLRAYPGYYWIADSGAKVMGAWPPAALISLIVFINSLCTLYPATYNHYMSDGEKIDEILRRNIDWNAVKQLAQQQFSQLNFNDLSTEELSTHLNRIADNIITSEKQVLRENIESKKGFGYVFKEEPSTAVTTTWQSLIGAYFGSQVLAPALTPLSAAPPALVAVSCGLLGATLLGSLFYKAESNRVSDKMVLQLLQAKEKEKEKEKAEKKQEKDKAVEATPPTNTKFIDSVAAVITGLNSIAGITGTLGASAQIHSSTLSTTFSAATATQAGLNSFAFNFSKVRDTLRSMFVSKPKYEFAESIDEWHEATVDQNNEVDIKKVERPASPATNPSALFPASSDDWIEVDPDRGSIELSNFKPI